MRSLDILKSEDRLRREANLRNPCVNGRYLMVHNVLAEAFSGDLTGISTADLPEYLSTELGKQTDDAPNADPARVTLAA